MEHSHVDYKILTFSREFRPKRKMKGKSNYEEEHKVRTCGLQKGKGDGYRKRKSRTMIKRSEGREIAILTKSAKDTRVVWERKIMQFPPVVWPGTI